MVGTELVNLIPFQRKKMCQQVSTGDGICLKTQDCFKPEGANYLRQRTVPKPFQMVFEGSTHKVKFSLNSVENSKNESVHIYIYITDSPHIVTQFLNCLHVIGILVHFERRKSCLSTNLKNI